MDNKIEFALKPVAGAAAAGAGFRAILETAKGNAMDLDEVIAEALDRGYIAGVKDALAKSIVKGVLDSMIAGVLRDGITRRIDDYLSVSMKVHGLFRDEHDEFDPARHKLALSLKQLNAFRPTFKDVEATNVNHKRQFRIYSVHSVNADGRNGHIAFGEGFIIKGADFRPDCKSFGVALHVKDGLHSMVSFDPPILSATDSEIRCDWPADFREPIGDGCGEIALGRMENLEESEESKYIRRSIRIKIIPTP